MFVLPLGLVVDAALRVHGGVLASTPVLWIAVQVESGALDSNGESLSERTRLLVRIKIRGLFYRYGRQNRDLTTYRMSILASEGIEPLFRLERRAHLERPRAPNFLARGDRAHARSLGRGQRPEGGVPYTRPSRIYVGLTARFTLGSSAVRRRFYVSVSLGSRPV